MKRKILIAVVLIGLLVAGGLFLALSNNSVQAASATNSTGMTALGFSRRHVDPEDLAQALGISIDELTEAKAVAVGKAIDQALDLGLITQEQVNELNSEENPSRIDLYRLLDIEGIEQIDYDTFLFEALGITEEEYETAIDTVEQAKLEAAVAEGTLTQEEADAIAGQRALLESSKFTDTIKAAYEVAIAEALEDGTITQAQADALLAKLENGNFSIFHTKMGHGDGHRPGGRPSKMDGDFGSRGDETLDDVDE